MFEKLERAQQSAPSYLHIKDDGAPYVCETCHRREPATASVKFVRPFTPDGAWHSVSHLSCLDPEWVEKAKDLGSI